MRNEMVAQPAHARDRAIARANRRPNALSVSFLAKALSRTRPARDAPPLGDSRQGCESYGVKIPCRQLPGSDD